jgi:hypothetical protein
VDGASIVYRASIWNRASIGYGASIGDGASIGYRASIGDGASIGYRASIGRYATFTKENVYCQLNLISDSKGYFTMYKAVRPDLTDFYSGKYQYKLGKGDKSITKRDQSIECGNNSWHFTNLQNAISFAGGKPFKIISVKVHLKNILSVYDKVRVNKFEDVQLVNLDFCKKDK